MTRNSRRATHAAAPVPEAFGTGRSTELGWPQVRDSPLTPLRRRCALIDDARQDAAPRSSSAESPLVQSRPRHDAPTQVLQWHHMLTSTSGHPMTTVAGLEANTLADGLFHLATWICVAAGSALLYTAWRDGRLAPPPRAHVGLLLAGWGLFNLLEGLIDHQLLGVHHVRDDLGGPIGMGPRLPRNRRRPPAHRPGARLEQQRRQPRAASVGHLNCALDRHLVAVARFCAVRRNA